MKLPWSSSTRECLQSRVDYVRKILLIMRKNLTQNQSIALVFLGYSISKKAIAPVPKYVEKTKNAKAPTNNKKLESFVGLDSFYGRMISDFLKKCYP